jgi:hypothetical protein
MEMVRMIGLGLDFSGANRANLKQPGYGAIVGWVQPWNSSLVRNGASRAGAGSIIDRFDNIS